MRPDDLAAAMVGAALDAVPGLDPSTVDDLMLGCGCPGGEQGHNMARVVAVRLGPARRRPGARPINEAFAAQVVASQRELKIDVDRLNRNGGAIAVGHPFGMTGARLTTTMLNSLRWYDEQVGLVTMCVGGGQGMAVVLERMS